MDDIVQRLRKWSISTHAVPASDIMDEAADVIEKLRAQRDLDGRQMSAMLADWQKMLDRCLNPLPTVQVAGHARPVSYEKSNAERVNWHTVWGTNHDAAPAAKANAESVVPQPTAGDRSGNPTSHSGTGDSLSEAEIDALQHVVEDGRIVKMQDYGALRSLLVRLRPEWEGDDDSDRPKPISDARLAALEQLSALDQELELEYGLTGNPLIKARPRKAAKTDPTQPRNGTPAEGSVQGEGSFPDSRNANEPVAWLVKGVEYDTGCEYEYVTNFKENAEAAVAHGGCVVPLYRQPQPTLTDAEREAVEAAYHQAIASEVPDIANILRGLLERTK